MNKLYVAILAAGVFALGSGASFAQAVQFPTGDAAWTVEIKYPRDANPQSSSTDASHGPSAGNQQQGAVRKATKVDVVQLHKIRVIRITWNSGPATEEWTVPGLPAVFKEDANGEVGEVTPNGLEMQSEMSDMAYDGNAFAWVTPDLLQSQTPVTFQGKQCLYYAPAAPSQAPHTDRHSVRAPSSSGQAAWVDSKTMLPVALNTGRVLCIFTFLPTPSGELRPPQKFMDEITYYKTSMGFQ